MYSNEIQEKASLKLPFSIYMYILEYCRVVPKMTPKMQEKICNHFKSRMCSKCGEYLDYPNHRLRRKHAPKHVMCKYFKYQTIPLYKYIRFEVNSSDVIKDDFVYYEGRVSNCPILMKVKKKRPLFWTRFKFQISDHNLYLQEMKMVRRSLRTNFKKKVLKLYKEDISVICLLPICNTDRILDIITNDDLVEYISHHHSNYSNIGHLLFYMLRNCRDIIYDPEYCKTIEIIIRDLKSQWKATLINKFNIDSIAYLNTQWFKEILLEFPQFINRLSDEMLQRFFTQNRRWFMSILCVKRPTIYKYISFDYRESLISE